MTYKEWFGTVGARFGMTESDIDVVLVNQQEMISDPEATVDVLKAKTALCKEFASVIPLANVTEGGYSVSWNMEAVKMWYKQTSRELGLADISTPGIRNRSNLW